MVTAAVTTFSQPYFKSVLRYFFEPNPNLTMVMDLSRLWALQVREATRSARMVLRGVNGPQAQWRVWYRSVWCGDWVEENKISNESGFVSGHYATTGLPCIVEHYTYAYVGAEMVCLSCFPVPSLPQLRSKQTFPMFYRPFNVHSHLFTCIGRCLLVGSHFLIAKQSVFARF